MNISEKFTQQQLLNIVMDIYRKREESESMEVTDFIQEIKQQIITIIS